MGTAVARLRDVVGRVARRSAVEGRRSRAGLSAFITARPAAVSLTMGRSPEVKSTQPAVTQRRSSLSSHSSEYSPSAPKVGVPSRPLRESRGSAVPRSSLTAAVSPNRSWIRATALRALRTTRVTVSGSPDAPSLERPSHTSQCPHPDSVSASSPK